MTYGKKITSDVGLSLSGSVLYSNTMSLPIMLVLAVTSGEVEKVQAMQGAWTSIPALSWLGFSAVVGTGISYSGWCASFPTSACAAADAAAAVARRRTAAISLPSP